MAAPYRPFQHEVFLNFAAFYRYQFERDKTTTCGRCTMSIESIYDLKLHENFSVSSAATCFRVAGGWIYSFIDNFSRITQYVFVPFSNEFQCPPDSSQPTSRLKSEIAAIADTLAHDIAKRVDTDRQALLNKLLQLSSV